MKNHVTIKDVAKAAGVSAATVSYVLNQKSNQTISEDTKKRVMQAVKDLGYVRNSTAKTLKSHRTSCIGIAIDKALTIPRYAETVQGIRTYLEENHYTSLLLPSMEQGGLPLYLSAYFENKVDGIIYVCADSNNLDRKIERFIIERKIPFVTFDHMPNPEISSVNIDYLTGAKDLTQLLIQKGYRRLHYIRPNNGTRQEWERERGVRLAVSSFPNASLTVHNLEFESSGGNFQMFMDFASEQEKKELFQYRKALRQILETIVPFLDPEDALILSWSGMEQIALPMLTQFHKENAVAVLAKGLLSVMFRKKLYYSYLPNYQSGRKCAEILLKSLRQAVSPEHIIVLPTLARHLD